MKIAYLLISVVSLMNISSAFADVQIISRVSGMCFNIYNQNGYEFNQQGTAVIQCPCNGQSNERFETVSNSDGSVSFVSRASGQCLDIYNGSTESGLGLEQRGCNGGMNQRFRLVHLQSGYEGIQPVSGGERLCLNVPNSYNGQDRQVGTNIIQYGCDNRNYSANEEFVLRQVN